MPFLQAAQAGEERAGKEVARLRAELAELQRAVEAGDPAAATAAAAQVCRFPIQCLCAHAVESCFMQHENSSAGHKAK